jgi:DNA-binding NarL/FixJ family response regulator
MTRILIADDHEIVRSGLRKIIESHAGWEVVAEVGNGKEAFGKALETLPDVAVLDYCMPAATGLEAARQILQQLPKTEVLILTMHSNEAVVDELIGAGARGCVLKTEARHELVAAIEALAIHKPYFSAALRDPDCGHRHLRRSRLTNREREIVRLIAEGNTNSAVATALDIGIKTVETHRAAAMRKLNVTSSAALVRYAVRNEIADA